MNKFVYPHWATSPKVHSLITTRQGGLSRAPYDSFNIATHVGDDREIVLANRKLLELSLPNSPFWLNQTHSNKVVCLNSSTLAEDILNYDACFTYHKNLVCVVMSADCIPILLTNKNADFVAAIHAGWRGIESNIIENTIKKVNAPAYDMLAYIGPAICKSHFEVGIEVLDLLVHSNNKNKQFFAPGNSNKFHCDLVGIAKLQLLNLGLPEVNIYLSNRCTYCTQELFYSYRREGITGRIASLIWLT